MTKRNKVMKCNSNKCDVCFASIIGRQYTSYLLEYALLWKQVQQTFTLFQ